jgi:hypothetical protein
MNLAVAIVPALLPRKGGCTMRRLVVAMAVVCLFPALGWAQDTGSVEKASPLAEALQAGPDAETGYGRDGPGTSRLCRYGRPNTLGSE